MADYTNKNYNYYQDSTTNTGAQTNTTTSGERTDTSNRKTNTSGSSETNNEADRAYNAAYGTTANLVTNPTALGYSAEQFDPDRLLALYKQAADTKRENELAAYGAAVSQYGTGLKNAQDAYIDAVRTANANAIASGAARETQAANELSAMLGMQQQGIEGATQLARDRAQIDLDYAQAMADALTRAESVNYERNKTAIDQALQKYVADDDILGMLGYGATDAYITNNAFNTNTSNESATEKTGKQITTEQTGSRTDKVKYS